MVKYIAYQFQILDKRLFFLGFCLLTITITFLSRELLINEDVYVNTFGEQMSLERIQEIFRFQNQWEWVTYVVLPIFYLLKFALIALNLSIGVLLFNCKVSFKKLFQIVLMAKTVFLMPAILKLLWFVTFQTSYTLADIQYFYPLSVLNLFEQGSLEPWFIYPLQTFNVFEIIYWLLLAYGLHLALKTQYDDALKLVLVSYVPGLLLWITTVTFLSVSLN